jgi:hypothetical protein
MIRRTHLNLAVAAIVSALATSSASAVLISDFSSPNTADGSTSTEGFTFRNGGDGWKANLTTSISGTSSGVSASGAMTGFIGGHTGSDAIGVTSPTTSQFTGITASTQFGYINSGGGRLGVVLTETPFVSAAVAGSQYTLTADFGRRLGNLGDRGGVYTLGFLVNYDPDGGVPGSLNNFNPGSNGNTGNFVPVVNGVSLDKLGTGGSAGSGIDAGTFKTISTSAFTATGGESLRAVILYNTETALTTANDPNDPNSELSSFTQGQFDNLAYSVTAAPVPEPTSIAMLGLVGLGALARRRQHA